MIGRSYSSHSAVALFLSSLSLSAQTLPKPSGKHGVLHPFCNLRDRNTLTNLAGSSPRVTTGQTQTDRIIGHFHIYYDTTGINAPALLDSNYQPIHGTVEQFVDSVGACFNHVWSYEIDSLGYSEPPLDTDNLYHIIVQDLGFGLYCETVPTSMLDNLHPSRYKSYVEIDNDFQSVYPPSRGIPALEVSAAHAFFHAIQIGAYGYWPNDRYFYEITATWMEDVVYDSVNDYYQYLSSDPIQSSEFSHPELRFTLSNGSIEYSRAIWGKFLEKRFSRTLVRRIWELMRMDSSLEAMNEVLAEVGSSLPNAFADYALWNSKTGPACDTDAYYTEGKHYPPMSLSALTHYTHPVDSITASLQAFSSEYFPIEVDSNQMLLIISNLNGSFSYSDDLLSFTYELKDEVDSTFRHLTNGLFVRLNVPDSNNWNSWELVPIVTVARDDPRAFVYQLKQNFPNPFNPNTTIEFSVLHSSHVALNIFNVLGQQVASLINEQKPAGSYAISWNASNVPSGVYICRLQAGSFTESKKLLLIK